MPKGEIISKKALILLSLPVIYSVMAAGVTSTTLARKIEAISTISERVWRVQSSFTITSSRATKPWPREKSVTSMTLMSLLAACLMAWSRAASSAGRWSP